MDRGRIRALLEQVKTGAVDADEAIEALARLPFLDVDAGRVDTHRALRTGIPEVVYAPGKTPEQIAEIVRTLRDAGQDVLVTRVELEVAHRVEALPSGATWLWLISDDNFNPLQRTLLVSFDVMP